MKFNTEYVGLVTLITSAITMIIVIGGCVTILVYDSVNRLSVPDFVQSMIQSFVFLAVGTLGLHMQSGGNSGRDS